MCAPSHHMVPARTHPTELAPSYRPRAAQLSDPPLSQQDMPHLGFQALPARHSHSSAYHSTISTTGRVWHPAKHGHARRSTGASGNRFSTWQPAANLPEPSPQLPQSAQLAHPRKRGLPIPLSPSADKSNHRWPHAQKVQCPLTPVKQPLDRKNRYQSWSTPDASPQD